MERERERERERDDTYCDYKPSHRREQSYCDCNAEDSRVVSAAKENSQLQYIS